MKIRLLCIGGMMTLAIGMAACSRPWVKTEYDHTLRFDMLKAYAWQPVAGQIGAGLPKDPTMDSRIQSAVDAALQAKGFPLVSAQKADLLLDYQASAEEKVDATYLKDYDRAAFMGFTSTLGTLKLTMRRPGSTNVVWQGSLQANIDMSLPLPEREAKLNKAVQALLEKFPPTP